MFDSYMNIPDNYIPNNLHKDDFKYCRETECLFTIGATNNFVQDLNLSRNEIKTINEPYPADKAVYFIFKNGISELFTITAEVVPVSFRESDNLDDCPIIVKCKIDDNFLNENNITISPYLDFKVELKIVLIDDSVLYTAKKNIKVITSLDK